MAWLSGMIPEGETVRWTSAEAFRPWNVALAIAGFAAVWLAVLLYADTFLELGWVLGILGVLGIPALIVAASALFPEAEVAVTEGSVVWLYPMDMLGRVSGGGKGVVALDTVGHVDLEEGGDTITLHGDDVCCRVEAIAGGRLEELARAIGRPARIWRECRSPAAVRARVWSGSVGAIGASAAASGMFLALTFFLDDSGGNWKFGALAGFASTLVLALAVGWFVALSSRVLPHLFAGRRLTGDERRDFVGWMTDLRWRGVRADGPDDVRLPRSRLQDWAMRLAYGEIPVIGERQPVVLIPGVFPEE